LVMDIPIVPSSAFMAIPIPCWYGIAKYHIMQTPVSLQTGETPPQAHGAIRHV
jgi:hypothetical protein